MQIVYNLFAIFFSGIQETLDKVKKLQTEALTWWDKLGIENKGLMEERDEVCKKIEDDLESVLFDLDNFMKSYNGFGYDGLE